MIHAALDEDWRVENGNAEMRESWLTITGASPRFFISVDSKGG
jgi:hypothetical protein